MGQWRPPPPKTECLISVLENHAFAGLCDIFRRRQATFRRSLCRVHSPRCLLIETAAHRPQQHRIGTALRASSDTVCILTTTSKTACSPRSVRLARDRAVAAAGRSARRAACGAYRFEAADKLGVRASAIVAFGAPGRAQWLDLLVYELGTGEHRAERDHHHPRRSVSEWTSCTSRRPQSARACKHSKPRSVADCSCATRPART